MHSLKVGQPAHETVYRAIRDKILFGDLAPGQAVTIQGLVDELGVSMTPVREAIRRLTAEGALEFQGNRRVTVPMMGERRFSEMVFARRAIEPKLAEIASENMTNEDVSKLAAVDAALNLAIESGDVQGYMQFNHAFHFTLYAHARSRVLTPIAATLWLRFGPLSRIICGKHGTMNIEDKHEETLHHIASGAHELVAEAILADINQGFQIVRDSHGWSDTA